MTASWRVVTLLLCVALTVVQPPVARAAEVLLVDSVAAELTVSQVSRSVAEPQLGDPVSYTVTAGVAAGTDDEASAVTVTQTLPSGVVPLGAFGTGWVCQVPSGQQVTCTNSNAPFLNGTSLPAVKVVAIVTGDGITSAAIQSGTSAVVSSSDAVSGVASSAAAGFVSSAPTNVTVLPSTGPTMGGTKLTISGANIISATAIEIGTTAEFQAGTPTVLLPCPAAPAAGCFTVKGSTLRISSMPAHSDASVLVKVVNNGVAGAAQFTYHDPAYLRVSQVSASVAEPQLGDPVSYTVTASVAAGTDEASAVTLTQTLPSGVVPLAAFGTGWVCQMPGGQQVTCTNSNAPFLNGTSLPAVKVVAIVTGAGITPAIIRSTSAVVSSSDAGSGIASSAAAGFVSSAPTNVTVSPASGVNTGGTIVTISGANITSATAIEIGTTAEFQAGTPTVLLRCPAAPAPECFTVSGSTLRISSMPAHFAEPVSVKVVNNGVAGTGAFTYALPSLP